MKNLNQLNILITGAGGPAAICTYKSLSKEIRNIHMADMDSLSAGIYLVQPENRHIIPAAKDPNFVNQLLEICIDQKIDILIPTVDFELLQLAKAKETYEKHGIKILVTDAEVLANIMNKHILLSHVESKVDVGQHGMLSDQKLDNWDGKKVVIKPISGSGSRGVEIYESVNDIPVAKLKDSDLMIQEFAEGPEYSIDVMVAEDGEVKAAVPRLRMRTDSGVSVTGMVELNQEVIDYVHEVIQEVGLTYMANVQVILTNDGPRLIEINPRCSGGLTLVIESGADTPLMSVKEMMGQEVETANDIKEIAMVRMFTERFMPAQDLVVA